LWPFKRVKKVSE